MAKPDVLIRDAEAFVRQALSHFSDAGADEKSIKAAATKVASAFEGVRRNEKLAA